MPTSSHELLIWRQVILCKQSGCLSLINNLSYNCSLNCRNNFLVAELSPASYSRSDVYPNWVKAFSTFVSTIANLTMLVILLCQAWGGVCIFLDWALTMTSDVPYLSHSISPNMIAWLWAKSHDVFFQNVVWFDFLIFGRTNSSEINTSFWRRFPEISFFLYLRKNW